MMSAVGLVAAMASAIEDRDDLRAAAGGSDVDIVCAV
jgi:hypothetical protein